MNKNSLRKRKLNHAAFASLIGIAIMSLPALCRAQSSAPVGPVLIGGQPQNQMVVVPGRATFSVTAIGTAPITYQWNRNGSPISGAISPTYTTAATTNADNGATFTVTLTNIVNGFTSLPATLTVTSAPVAPTVTAQPLNISVSQGNNASFHVVASGTGPLSYQWQKNGLPIGGATAPDYMTPATSSADNNAQFTVTVTNGAASITSNPATLAVNSQVFGVGGVQPVLAGFPNDVTGVQYRFHVVTNKSQALKIVFGWDGLYTPGSTITYNIQSNVYSGAYTYADGGCTTYPPLGIYTEADARLTNATVDYPYNFGQQPAVASGISTSDPVNWPVQTILIDNIPNLYASFSTSQFKINGIEGLVTIRQGGILTDISAFQRCKLPMLPGIYRMWTITTQMAGYAPVVNQVVVPDADGRYIAPWAAMSLYSEFLNGPGAFSVQYWDFAYMRESNPALTPVSTFATNWNYDGSGQDFGVHVVSVNGQDRIEFSNVPGNAYLPGNLPFSIALTSDLPQLSTMSAANFTPGAPVAAESIVAGFGHGLALTTASAPQDPPLPTSLAGTSVTVKDSSQTERLAPLWFVSPGRVNYLVPAGTKPGLATVTVASQDQVMAAGTLQVDAVAPGLFSANGDGQGVAAAYALWANGTRPWQYVFQCGSTQGSCVSVPLDLGTATEQMYFVLYGTGIRGRSSLAAVTAKVGGVDTPVEYAGPVESMVGLDQINLRVPRGLAGSGEVDIVLTADGKVGNTVKVSIK